MFKSQKNDHPEIKDEILKQHPKNIPYKNNHRPNPVFFRMIWIYDINITPISMVIAFPWGFNPPKKKTRFFQTAKPTQHQIPQPPQTTRCCRTKGHLKLRSQTKSWRSFFGEKATIWFVRQPNQQKSNQGYLRVFNLKWWVFPPNHLHFNRVFNYKPSILGKPTILGNIQFLNNTTGVTKINQVMK